MVRRYGSVLGMLVTGVLVVAGCGTPSNNCVSDVECTTPGEICLVSSNQCGCEPVAVGSGGTDTCTAADANTICHPDRGACEAKCASDSDCLAAGEICDTQTSACRAAPGCSSPGNECSSTQVCDPATDRCIDQCTSTSCTTGQVCNDQTKLCVADCTVAGNECPSGQTCDPTSKVCVESCGATSCEVDEACGPAGDCIKRCDAATDPTACTGADVCDTATGLCDPGCDAPNTNIVCDALTEVCSSATGQCIEKCTGNIDCAGSDGFCNLTTGLCETPVDITECNDEGSPANSREYVNPDSNMCAPTSELAQCPRAQQGRDDGRAESPNGPTIYLAESIARTESVPHCSNGPEVQFYAEYYDPTGGVRTTRNGISADVFQQVGTTSNNTPDSVTSNFIDRCGTDKTDGVCLNQTMTETRGAFLFTLCRPASARDEIVAIYMRDGSGNYGNAICVELKAEHDL